MFKARDKKSKGAASSKGTKLLAFLVGVIIRL
jgi:hypothetical protein